MGVTGRLGIGQKAGIAGLVAALLLGPGSTMPAAADPLPAGALASRVQAVGYTEMNGHPAFKLTIQQVGRRWYLYAAHQNISGWSVVDVTEPANPKLATFIPGPENTKTNQVDLADNILVTALGKPEKAWDVGMDPTRPYQQGIALFDVKDPLHPKLLGTYDTGKPGGIGTHRNMYFGGRYVHLAADLPGYVGNIYLILDIMDPRHPVEAGRWWVPGQHVAGGETPATDPVVSLHNPNFVEGNRVYLSYGDAGMVVLDISDVAHPRQIAQLTFEPHAFLSVHTVASDLRRHLAFINSETIVEGCKGPPEHAEIVDIANPLKPFVVAKFPVPIPPPGLGYSDFCDKGGRFGPHNQSQLQHNRFVQRQGNLVYLTYFNAGLRIYDVSDRTHPRETGWFMPPLPRRSYIGGYGLNLRTEDVVVDTRGYAYISDSQQGVWIVKYTGGRTLQAASPSPMDAVWPAGARSDGPVPEPVRARPATPRDRADEGRPHGPGDRSPARAG